MRCKEALTIPSRRVKISSGIHMLVHGMPVGIDYLFSQICAAPVPPFKEVQAKGMPLQRMYDERDPKFIKDLEAYEHRKIIFSVWIVTNKDPDNVYETTNPVSPADIDAIYKELRDIGFTSQDYMLILSTAMDVANVRSQEETKKDFSEKGQESQPE